MHRVVIALYPAALASSITLPMELLRAADNIQRSNHRGQSVRNIPLSIDIAASDLNPVETSSGLLLTPSMTFQEVKTTDMIILPAMWRNPVPTLRQQQELIALLGILSDQECYICAVGTASSFLAEAGVLNNRAATTHWYYFEWFTKRYPDVNLKTRHLITQSDNIYCAGSVNSVADLIVHIVSQWYGNRVARAVESQFSPEIRRPFQAHAYMSDSSGAHQDEIVISAQQWLQDNAHRPLQISELSEYLQLSSRSINRRFIASLGESPLHYLTHYRMTTAKELLRTSNLSIGEIAFMVGYQDVSHFSSLFRRHGNSSPSAYRNRVRGKVFTLP
jgi:transcriptional regulator GlxA family with amidase domain